MHNSTTPKFLPGAGCPSGDTRLPSGYGELTPSVPFPARPWPLPRTAWQLRTPLSPNEAKPVSQSSFARILGYRAKGASKGRETTGTGKKRSREARQYRQDRQIRQFGGF